MIKICETCDKEFNARPSSVGRFCSKRCYGDWKKTVGIKLKLKFKCQTCGDYFSGRKGRSKFCSQPCSGKNKKTFMWQGRRASGKDLVDLGVFQTAQRPSYVRRNFGLDPEQLVTLIENQRGLCPVSMQPVGTHSDIDHCHATGKIRGVMSKKVNKGLGLFKDNVQRLSDAANYLISPPINEPINRAAKRTVPCRNERYYNHLWNKFRVEAHTYDDWASRRQGRCDICRQETKLCVDHCHKMNVVRGLLCLNCNSALGSFNDDYHQCISAALYLVKASR